MTPNILYVYKNQSNWLNQIQDLFLAVNQPYDTFGHWKGCCDNKIKTKSTKIFPESH